MAVSKFSALIALSLLSFCSGKVFDRCDFVRELTQKHQIPAHQIPTWTCIAYRESGFDTETVKLKPDGSYGHGIFQIRDYPWCNGLCKYSCDELKSDDISKSVACALTVWERYNDLYKNGFEAWPVYKYCNNPTKVNSYVHNC